MIRVGCAGFPIGQDRYWRTLSFLEAKTGEAMPRTETLALWRKGAPAGAEISVQAFRLITHQRDERGFPPAGKRLTPFRAAQCGAFRDALEVHEAWMSTKVAARALGARIVVFETPATFHPSPDRLRDMYRFFKSAERGTLSFVWQTRGAAWDVKLMDRVSGDLGLIRAFDPLKEKAPSSGRFIYMRPMGPRMGSLSVDNMATIREAAGRRSGYLVFSHRDAFRDAEKLL
jgi:uncharacterized protein YecE (DUF72 family)